MDRDESCEQPGAGQSEERRQLTIMFIDMVGSTALSERLDPEDFFSLLGEYHQICDRHVGSFGGHVARRFGDGVLAFFGLPRAHEDDPERAIHAALTIAATFRNREFTLDDGETIRLSVRIAVNTGIVVVGRLNRASPGDQMSVLGRPAHIASRLQELAAPNGVVVGPVTHELVRRAFRCSALGEHSFKGVKAPVAAWAVEEVIATESRFAKLDGPPLTPLIGRSEELARLRTLWDQAGLGGGTAIAITGEPGIGKSRLLQALRVSIEATPHAVIAFQCSPLHVNTPLSPMIAQIRRAAGLGAKDTPAQILDKLSDLLRDQVPEIERAIRYYGALLSVPAHDDFQPADLSYARERELALDLFAEVPLLLSKQIPVLMPIEDVHWIDPTSIEVLRRLLARLDGHRIFMTITHRSDYKADWLKRARVPNLALPRLPAEQCHQMIAMVTGTASLPRAALEQIAKRTDGVPLFVEEFTRAVLDTGVFRRVGSRLVLNGSLPDPLVPATVQDSLMERLDRLGRPKRIAQEASVLGRHFSYRELRHLNGRSQDELSRSLRQLEMAGLLQRHGVVPEASFVFKHAMIQEAAYASLVKEERSRLHARAASWYRQAATILDSGELGLLGHHYSRAGMIAEAVDALLGAGKAALKRAASKESAAHLRQGLELVPRLPTEKKRTIVEIELQLTLAMAHIAREGWSGRQVEQAYTRALTLCRDDGTMRQRSIALWGVTIATVVGSQFTKALAHAEEFVAFGKSCDNDEVALMAHAAALLANFFTGRLPAALASADAILLCYDTRSHANIVEIYQHDAKILALVYGAIIDWITGRPGRAQARCEEARRYARRLGHPFMLAFTLLLGGSDHLFERNLAAKRELVEEGMKIADEYGFAACQIFGPLWAAEAIVAGDPTAATIEKLAGLLAIMLQGDNYLTVPFYQLSLAQEIARAGDVARALTLCAEAEALMQQTGEIWFEPEFHRVRGELLCLPPQVDRAAAKSAFRRGLDSAHRLGTIGWELRIALGMARQPGSEDERQEALTILSRAKAKFAAGETSIDLAAAEALLLQRELPA